MRPEVTKKFVESIEPFLDNIDSVAIVGGSLAEPEILELQEIKEVMVDVYGVEESEYCFDLNKDNRCEKKYDLSRLFWYIFSPMAPQYISIQEQILSRSFEKE